MSPLSPWLPAPMDQPFDMVVKVVGCGSAGVLREIAGIARALAAHGVFVIGQEGRPGGAAGEVGVTLRLASRSFHSMGHGCDVLLYVGDGIPEFRRYGLQRGSVLLWEPPEQERLRPLIPDGLTVYAVPLGQLSDPHEVLSGRGCAALGALCQLLGVPKAALNACTSIGSAPRSFEAGFDFAARCVAKRDVYSIPLKTGDGSPWMLTGEQAAKLGFAVGSCVGKMSGGKEFDESPETWLRRHLDLADGMVSVLRSEMHPSAQVYRGPEGTVIALFGGDDAAIHACINGHRRPRVVVAADVRDIVRLLIDGQRLVRDDQADIVVVALDDELAVRQHNIEVGALRNFVAGCLSVSFSDAQRFASTRERTALEQDPHGVAAVGYVAWGTAQGVVRDALTLCREFGLNVSALYPIDVVPFPIRELECFAQTVGRVVLVESTEANGYADRVVGACCFPVSVVRPERGEMLTPMEIFLREGLGTV